MVGVYWNIHTNLPLWQTAVVIGAAFEVHMCISYTYIPLGIRYFVHMKSFKTGELPNCF